LTISAPSSTEENSGFGIRGALGTNITGGIAYGAGANYFMGLQKGGMGADIMLFGGSFEETTDIFVFGLFVNYFYNYTPGQAGSFLLLGLRLGSINVSW